MILVVHAPLLNLSFKLDYLSTPPSPFIILYSIFLYYLLYFYKVCFFMNSVKNKIEMIGSEVKSSAMLIYIVSCLRDRYRFRTFKMIHVKHLIFRGFMLK